MNQKLRQNANKTTRTRKIGLNNKKHQSHRDKMFECLANAVQAKIYEKFDPNPANKDFDFASN